MHVAQYHPDSDFIYHVEEQCPNCSSMIAVNVDEKLTHLETKCPVCGKKMMICSMCDRNCDWTPAGCCMDQAHCGTVRVKDVMNALRSFRYTKPQNDYQRTVNHVVDSIMKSIRDLAWEGSDA